MHSPSTSLVMYWLSEISAAWLLFLHPWDDLSIVQLWGLSCSVHSSGTELTAHRQTWAATKQWAEQLAPRILSSSVIFFFCKGLDEGKQNITKWHGQAKSSLCSAQRGNCAPSFHCSLSSCFACTGRDKIYGCVRPHGHAHDPPSVIFGGWL